MQDLRYRLLSLSTKYPVLRSIPLLPFTIPVATYFVHCRSQRFGIQDGNMNDECAEAACGISDTARRPKDRG